MEGGDSYLSSCRPIYQNHKNRRFNIENLGRAGASFHFNLWGGGSGAVSPAGSRGQSPLVGWGAKPPEAPAFLAF